MDERQVGDSLPPQYTLYIFGYRPHEYFEQDGILAGFRLQLDENLYHTPRGEALFQFLGVSTAHPDYLIGILPDGRWALIGLVEEGQRFAIELSLSELKEENKIAEN